ncbi:hypothetical protein, partial [Acidithrix ferrooxidans]|uniref:hypothetical protein n=1 Tax=Acidithrix ferrooxidans TaxID=1280514 RepID=UPI001F3DD66E
SPRYAALYSWLHQPECKLDQRLSASLRLFESFQGDEEFAEKLTQILGRRALFYSRDEKTPSRSWLVGRLFSSFHQGNGSLLG